MRTRRRLRLDRCALATASLVLSMLSSASLAAAQTVLTVAGCGANLGTLRQIADAFSWAHPEVQVEILPSIGSGGAVKAILAGAVDLGLASRPLTDAERVAGAREILYARTPLVFAVHAQSATGAVSTRELIDIYAGGQRYWADGSVVRPVLRPTTDPDSVILATSVPGLGEALEEAYERRGVPVAATDQQVAELVETMPGGVGPASLAQIMSEGRGLKALALDGVVPSPETLADRTYPLVKPLYFVVGPAPRPEVTELIEFARGKQGTAILEATGHLVEPARDLSP